MEETEETTETPTQAAEETSQETEESPHLQGVEMEAGEEAPIEEQEAAPQEQQETTEETETKPINQEAVDKKINKLTFEKHEAKRAAEAAEKRAAEAEAKLKEAQGAADDIVVPEMPDTFDSEYQAKVKARDEAIQKLAQANAQKEILQKQQADELQAAAEAKTQAINNAVTKMYADAKDLGVTDEELKEADKTVANYINDPDLATFMLNLDESALVVKYLASSAQELETLQGMSSIEASAYIATTVVPAAAQLKPNVTTTPDPITIPKGKAGGEKKDPFLDGVEFE